jgi:hypothetical protein
VLRHVLAVLTVSSALPTQAHHSFAMFDQQHQLTLRGSVKEFRWTNPHAFIQLLVTDATGGAVAEWSIEMTSPEHLVRGGWKPRLLKAGDQIAVIIHPLRDGARGGQFMSGTRRDGTPLGGRAERSAAASKVGSK